ncbi:DNA polymerase I [Microbacterium phage Moleficent]|nr:DNA polymerase I [Microbacterium phage Moleficent]
MQEADIYGLDYETFSSVPLGGKDARGLPNYVASPDFRALIVSVASINGAVTYDFVHHADDMYEYLTWLKLVQSNEIIMAHNAPFERAVTKKLAPWFDWRLFQDSAVDARCLGAESKLIVASRQLTNSHKLEEGNDLVMLFCVPNSMYPEGATAELIKQHGHEEKWKRFIEYCEMDAIGSREIRLTAMRILESLDPDLIEREAEYERCTYEQNQAGWGIDIALAEKMKQRAWANGIIAQRAFVDETGEQLNFNSHPQMKKYLEDRGVKFKSLDKYHLPIVLENVKQRIEDNEQLMLLEERDSYPELERAIGRLKEAEALLETKMEIGGSTLSKLPVILRLVSEDGILRDQYMHVGAGQTFRTSGRGVQMQNLGKLKMMKDEDGNEYVRDISTIYDLQHHWSNGDMAGQLRQVFTSRHPQGELIVGDFSGVESRGLAYQAGEEWKLQVFRDGRDVYKELYVRFTKGKVSYEDVTPAQRPRGKYSELSCGYQASGVAVQDFMFRLGFVISEEEALQNVMDWRGACPAIVNFWGELDWLIKEAVSHNEMREFEGAYGLKFRATPLTLESMSAQHPGSVSMALQIIRPNGKPIVTRFVHGLYWRGKKLCYYKPAENLYGGPLWKDTYKHPKLKGPDGKPLEVYYSIYGGKLAGIFTQSMCREMFFESTVLLHDGLRDCPNAVVCGQFHDELNVDWWPEEGGWSKEQVMEVVTKAMTTCSLDGFPLDADIKSAYRYIK